MISNKNLWMDATFIQIKYKNILLEAKSTRVNAIKDTDNLRYPYKLKYW
jgi:hypothetical protein